MLPRPVLALTAAAFAVLAAPTAASAAPLTSTPTPAAPADRAADPVDDAPCDRLLAANTTYRANGATYRTDARGRPQTAEAENLTASVADRGPCQTKVGHMADAPNYDGGHMIAATLHGVDERYDLVPQWYSVNRGLYLRMESGAKSCLDDPGGRIMHYKIRVSYPDLRTVVPDTFHTDVRVGTTGHPAQTIDLAIPNRALQPTEYQDLRGRLNQKLDAAGCTT